MIKRLAPIFFILLLFTQCDNASDDSAIDSVNQETNDSYDCSSFIERTKDVFNDSSIIYQNKGIMHQFDDNLDSAIFYFDKAIKADSSMYVAHSNKGNVLIRLDSNDQAIKEYERVVELHPNRPEFHMHLATVYDYLGHSGQALKEYEISINLYNELISCSDDKPLVEGCRMDRAIVYMLSDNKEKGLAELEALKEENPLMQNLYERQMEFDKEQFFEDLFE